MRVLKTEHFSQLKEQKQAETELMSLYLKEKLIRKDPMDRHRVLFQSFEFFKQKVNSTSIIMRYRVYFSSFRT